MCLCAIELGIVEWRVKHSHSIHVTELSMAEWKVGKKSFKILSLDCQMTKKEL